MRTVVVCEESGVTRRALAQRGYRAVSVDLLPGEHLEFGEHIQGDVRTLGYGFLEQFDFMLAHPPCTRLANSGVRWLDERNLWGELDEAAEFFRWLLDAPVAHIAVENPIPHRYAVERIGRKYDQIVQPWMFGHGETKATAFWLKNLPPLTPTCIVGGREQRIWRLPPGPERARERSRTYQGIAEAIADQWPSPVAPKESQG